MWCAVQVDDLMAERAARQFQDDEESARNSTQTLKGDRYSTVLLDPDMQRRQSVPA